MLTLTERETRAYIANDREALALIYAGEEEMAASLDEDHANEIEKLNVPPEKSVFDAVSTRGPVVPF